jgi:hypothetical protein
MRCVRGFAACEPYSRTISIFIFEAQLQAGGQREVLFKQFVQENHIGRVPEICGNRSARLAGHNNLEKLE